MTTSTIAPRPAATPPAGGAPGKTPVPAGAAKMQSWYINNDGRKVKTATAVPVDAEDQRTAHRLHTCPKTNPVDGGGVKPCGHAEWLLPAVARFCPEHGTALAAPKTNERRKMLLAEYIKLHGEGTRPWGLLAATAAAGAVVQLADVPAAGAALLVPVAAGTAYLVTRRRVTRREIKAGRLEKGRRAGRKVKRIVRAAQTAAVVAGAASSWVVMTAAADPSTWVGRLTWGVLVTGWAVGSYPFWLRVERRRAELAIPPAPVEAPAAAPVAVVVEQRQVDPVEEQAIRLWNTRIARPGGPLPGTRLLEFRRIPACLSGGPDRPRRSNWTATVRAVEEAEGTINMRAVRPALIGAIATAYGCTYGDVSFAADESDLSIAYVRVQPDNPLAEVRMYQGPDQSTDWTKGLTVVGRFEDGEQLRYVWYDAIGAVHEVISGCSGSGKSELVALLISASLHSNGLVLDWLGDPQGGQSYGVLKDHVDYFARDTAEIKFMLIAAVKEMFRRNDELSKSYTKTWRPTRDMPLLTITLDECQDYLADPVVAELITRLVTMARKCGIKLRFITQIAYAYNLGGDSNVKENASMQQFTFRANTGTAGAASAPADGDSPIDPAKLPKNWGKGTCGYDHETGKGQTTAGLVFVQGAYGRDVYGRCDFTGDDMKVWLYDEAGNCTITPGVFSQAAREVSGALWGGWRRRYQYALTVGRNDEDLLRNGKALELIELAAALASENPAAAVASLNQAVTLQGGQPETTRARDTVYGAAYAAASQHEHGHAERKAITALTKGMASSTRDAAIGDLIADGKLARVEIDGKVRPGVFRIVDPPSADDAAGGQPQTPRE